MKRGGGGDLFLLFLRFGLKVFQSLHDFVLAEAAGRKEAEELLFLLERAGAFEGFRFFFEGLVYQFFFINKLVLENVADGCFVNAFLAEFLLDDPEPLRFAVELFTKIQARVFSIIEVFVFKKKLGDVVGCFGFFGEFFLDFFAELAHTVASAGENKAGVCVDFFVRFLIWRFFVVHKDW